MGWTDAVRRAWNWARAWPETADHLPPGARQSRLSAIDHQDEPRLAEVWTVPSPQVRTIVATTDLSDLSMSAVVYAAGLAARLGTNLVVLHVAGEDEAYEALRDHGMYLDQFLRWRKGDVEAALLAAVPHPTLGAVPTEVRVEFGGHPSDRIARVARDLHANLIVMATHGRSGLGRLILGSVAERVVREAPCPVVLFRPRAVRVAASAGDADRAAGEAGRQLVASRGQPGG